MNDVPTTGEATKRLIELAELGLDHLEYNAGRTLAAERKVIAEFRNSLAPEVTVTADDLRKRPGVYLTVAVKPDNNQAYHERGNWISKGFHSRCRKVARGRHEVQAAFVPGVSS